MAGVLSSRYLFRQLPNVSKDIKQFCNVFRNSYQHKRWQRSFSSVQGLFLKNTRTAILFVAGCGVSFAVGSYYHKFKIADSNIVKNVPFKPYMCSNDTGFPTKNFNFIADVAEKVAPTVVYIETSKSQPFFGGSFVSVSNGSGFIVQSDGLILTNAHVVANTQHVTVKLQDGRVFPGIVEDVDLEADLAAIKIDAKNLPVLGLAPSSKIRLGEFVIALGNPLTLSLSITAGIVSATHRASRELGISKEFDYIQTDAAINSGNSGGPLVNLNGEAIGINTMKVTEGISFAIPSDRVAQFLAKIEKKRKGWWPVSPKPFYEASSKYIGVSMLTLTQSIIQELHQRNTSFPKVSKGCLIWRVHLDSPAFQAGLKAGDVIIKINNSDVYSVSEVYKMVQSNKVLSIQVQRGEEILHFNVKPMKVQ